MNARELLPLINPKLGPKYSPNLHAWVRKNWKDSATKIVVTRPDNEGLRYIGLLHKDFWMSGTRLNAVLCNGAKEKTWALSPEHHSLKAGIDGTFWKRYMRDGRCAIDADHTMVFIGDETRWKTEEGTRECQWCGHHVQVLLDWTEVVHKTASVPA